jgi:methylphosphotriester-DNA--protein-cysteine methyltransferase
VETRYSTTDPRIGECGQILETLKGQPPSDCKLQIYDLVEARRRLADGHGVTETAFAIGYTSASQFSREYKRAFRRAPVRDLFIPNR